MVYLKDDCLMSCRHDTRPRGRYWRWGVVGFFQEKINDDMRERMMRRPCSRLISWKSKAWATAHRSPAWALVAQIQSVVEGSRDEK